MYRVFAGISSLMMSWTARNNWGRSSAAFAASEIRYVAAWSCAACSRSVTSLFEPRCVEGRRRRGDIPEDQDARRMDRGGSLIRRRRTTWPRTRVGGRGRAQGARTAHCLPQVEGVVGHGGAGDPPGGGKRGGQNKPPRGGGPPPVSLY